MRSVRFHEQARAELVHEVSFYTAISPSLGERFDKTVQSAVGRAAALAELGSPFVHGTRRVLTKKFPFSVVYIVVADEVFIVAIAAHGRRPGYWRSRVSGA